MARVYVAGPWIHRLEAREFAEILQNGGHTITHDWWNYEGEDQDKETPEALRHFAQLDVDAVRTADVVVVLNSAKSEGKASEQGMAIAWGKPIICITAGEKPTSNIFHYLPNYTHVTSWGDAIVKLEAFIEV